MNLILLLLPLFVLSKRQARIKIVLNPDLPRLGNAGLPEPMPSTNAGQVPGFGKISIHWIELAGDYTPIGGGAQLYKSPTYPLNDQSSNVIFHDSSILSENNTEILSIDADTIKPGTYTYLRTSVAYQEYSVLFNLNEIPIPNVGILNIPDVKAYIASFLGVNTRINEYTIDGSRFVENQNKLQGYGAMVTNKDFTEEARQLDAGFGVYCDNNPSECQLKINITWDGTPGSTTVPNPNPNVTIPAGSCIVVGKFKTPLIIPDPTASNYNDKNLKDILITAQYSINNSFEWIDDNNNDKWDIYAANKTKNEKVVDMGTRGLWPIWEDAERKDGSIANKYSILFSIVFVIFSSVFI